MDSKRLKCQENTPATCCNLTPATYPMDFQIKLKKRKPYLYEIPKGTIEGMRVPAYVYINEVLLHDVASDRSLEQLVNVATLPGVVERVAAMPDMHEGYGFPIGAVAATEAPHGAVSPGGVGYDINCGVRLLASDLPFEDVKGKLEELGTQIMRAIPSGTGRGGRIKLDSKGMEAILKDGAQECVRRGWAKPEDVDRLEERGRMDGADPSLVSDRAKSRGRDQLGTLGSGNHFLEVQRVDEIFDGTAAKAFGLFENQTMLMIHTGSRGLGHQICTDYVRAMLSKLPEYGFTLPDKELACAPADSKEGSEYLAAMAAGANFAWANRQVIEHHVRIEWDLLFGKDHPLRTVYDVCHNIAKKERHAVSGKETDLIVHRKGATRAFGPGHPDVPSDYQKVGQPVLIPGSMGTASYVLAGTREAMEQTFGTVCHGAGRRMSRHEAKKAVSGEELRDRLEDQGIIVRCFSAKGLAEEAPIAYKDVEEVVNVVEDAKLSRKVARLRPIAVVKGE
jgi:tRNA-splicing ligase RtcB